MFGGEYKILKRIFYCALCPYCSYDTIDYDTKEETRRDIEHHIKEHHKLTIDLKIGQRRKHES